MNKSQEWHDQRRQGITGTDMGAILGMSPYRSALDVYLEKIGQIDSASTNYSEAMRFGNLLEDIVANEYARRKNIKVSIEPNILQHKEHPCILGSIDRWVGDKEYVLECKTIGFMQKHVLGEEGTDQIPEYWLTQIAFYAAIAHVPKVDIAVLIGGQDFRIYTYHANKDFQDKLIKAAVNFWKEHVLKKIAPPVKSIEGLAKLYNVSNEQPIEADEDLVALVAEVKEMQLMKKDLEDDIKEGQFKIQDFMRDYDVLKDDFNNTIATWKNRKKSNKFDAKKFKIDLPNIYKDYLKESTTSRTFLIK